MITECEATGKNIEQAITNALFELKALREDVDIKILDQGGFFRKAKVFVKISEDALEKYNKIKKLAEEEKRQTEQPKVEVEKEEEVAKTEEVKEEATSFATQETKVEEKAPSKQVIDESARGKQFLEGLLEVLDNDSKVLVEEKEDEIFYEIKGEDAHKLIGYRGDCLNSIQYLISLVNSKNNRHSKKVRLDIDNFKDKRKESLEALAGRMAKKVLKTRHSARLEPMTAYERRIIHTIIQTYPELTSYSTGEEPNRFLTITIKQSEE